MNKIILHGRISNDIELNSTGNGIEYCKFSVAVDRPASKDKERITDFLPCTAWRKTAAFLNQYFHKGDGVIIEGTLQADKYEKDGQKRTLYNIQVDRVEFPYGKKGAFVTDNNGFTEVSDDDSLPF